MYGVQRTAGGVRDGRRPPLALAAKRTHTAAPPQQAATTAAQTDSRCGSAAEHSRHHNTNGRTLRWCRQLLPLLRCKRTHTAAAPQQAATTAAQADSHCGSAAEHCRICIPHGRTWRHHRRLLPLLRSNGRTSRHHRSKQLPLWHKRTSQAAAPHTAAFGAPRSPRTHHRIIDICRHRVYNVAIQPARHGYAAPNNR